MKKEEKKHSSDDNPPSNGLKKWRAWHEREVPVRISGQATRTGVGISIVSKQYSNRLNIDYPNSVWQRYPKENKIKLVDNIAYIFTAHLPFLLKGNIRLEYDTGYPQSYSWANHCFMRHLPAYWYLQGARRGMGLQPLLKTMMNSNAVFAQTKDVPPRFPESVDENLIIPFTFGKDSFLTYHTARELGLKPTLLFFEDPMDEGYEGKHKKELFKAFGRVIKEKTYFVPNPLGNLRQKEGGWFGWELALTSWALLSLPFAYKYKAGYIVFSNEKSVNTFFYDKEGFKIATEFEQSDQAIEELSLLTQALSEGEVYTTTFLQGLHDLGIIAILKNRYRYPTFNYLMSCWSETEAGREKRWCGACSKCARIYAYLCANGIDPEREAGFSDNMFKSDKAHYFNIFKKATGATGWDAFGVNTDEMELAFYLSWLRGRRDPLLQRFQREGQWQTVRENFSSLVNEYFDLHAENSTPPQWKARVNRLYRQSLKEARREVDELEKKSTKL